MFSVLPDLTPRDSHTLWYTSTRHPLPTASLDASSLADAHRLRGGPGPGGGPNNAAHSALAIDRSLLGRLRDDERLHERRRANAGNMGQTWLKPPGVTKTLFQLREERREAEEHAEAMRREMVAQELADAEAANATGATGVVMEEGGEGVAAAVVRMDGDGDEVMMMEGEEEDMSGMGGRDLDDDIPDADEGGFGFDGVSDEEDEDEDESDDDEEGEESYLPAQARLGRRQTNEVANIRAVEDRMRQMIARGGGASVGGDMYGADEDVDEEDQAHILEEDDLVGAMYPDELEPDMDVGMDANLDDDIPEAESGGYEHTDSEASLSSDEEASEQNVSYGGMRTPHLPPPRSSLPGGSAGRSGASVAAPGSWRFSARRAPRSSMDLSSILSRDGSSVQGSSPRLQRRA